MREVMDAVSVPTVITDLMLAPSGGDPMDDPSGSKIFSFSIISFLFDALALILIPECIGYRKKKKNY